MQIWDRSKSGFCIGGNGFRRNHDVHQRGTLSYCAGESARKFASVFDALRIHAERTRHSRVIAELQSRAYGLSESDHLVMHLDLPCAVICNDKHGACAMAHSRIELYGVEAEGAVSGSNNDGPIRIGETRGNPIRDADPQTTERSGIQNR
jgi:hypothetical protein